MTLLQYVFNLSERQAWRFTAAEAAIWRQYVNHGWPAVPRITRSGLVRIPLIDRGHATQTLDFILAMFDELEANDVVGLRFEHLRIKRREYRILLDGAGHTPSSLQATFTHRVRLLLGGHYLPASERQMLVAFLRS